MMQSLQVSQRTHKCEANRADDTAAVAADAAGDDVDVNSSIVRNRPTWLERLVTAQQQTVTTDQPIVLEAAAVDNVAIEDVTVQMDQSPSQIVLNENPSHDSVIAFDPKTYYQVDGLPSFDLSQLTLNFDSELIFPS